MLHAAVSKDFLARLELITENRKTNGPLPGGAAPFTTSESFKFHSDSTKPRAKAWDHMLSVEGSSRTGSTLKASGSVLAPSSSSSISSDVVSLGTARPWPGYFPWNLIRMDSVPTVDMLPWQDKSPATTGFSSCAVGEEDYDLSVALNYGFAAGSPQLLRFVTEHIQLIHDPPYDDWLSCITCGTTAALDTVFRMLCDRGDWILTEQHTYSGTLEALKPLGIRVAGIQMDDEGLLPEELDARLQSWDVAGGPKPRVLYTIPSGQNPTGVTQSSSRRKAIFRVAEEHDLYIIEDDPYFFLRHNDRVGHVSHTGKGSLFADEYLRSLPPSYLSLDTSGRVLRLDATSKILAPGLRCSWLTACAQIVNRFVDFSETTTVAPSGLSQIALYKLLDVTWGHHGFVQWLSSLSHQYTLRRDAMLAACDHHLPRDICSWNVPDCGMFVWLRMDPLAILKPYDVRAEHSESLCRKIEDAVWYEARRNGVIISKGTWFEVGPDKPAGIRFRLTFAAAPVDALERAIQRLGDAINKVVSTIGGTL